MKRFILTLALVSTALILAFTRLSFAQCGGGMHSDGHSSHSETASSEAKSIAYPIEYCIVSGEKLGDMGDPVKYENKDRVVYFCCKGCIKKFEAEPVKYLAMLDEAVAKAAVQPASAATDTSVAKASVKLTKLDWCIVSGESLGEMGKPVVYKWKDRELTFCCKSCVKMFDKQPIAYIERLDSALAGLIVQPKDVESKPSGTADHSGHVH